MVCEAQILFNYQKEEVKKHSHVTTMIRYVWYVWIWVIYTSPNLQWCLSTYMYAPIGKLQLAKWWILDGFIFKNSNLIFSFPSNQSWPVEKRRVQMTSLIDPISTKFKEVMRRVWKGSKLSLGFTKCVHLLWLLWNVHKPSQPHCKALGKITQAQIEMNV
jgi:hypothetical protein